MKTLKITVVCGLLSFGFITPSQAAMGDDPLLGKFILDRLETSDADGSGPLNWELDAWLGKDLNKLWLRSEGERIDSETEQINEISYSRAIAPFWDAQLGYRQERAANSISRDFISASIRGLAPYLFDTRAAIVVGEDEQFGIDAEFEYEFLFTQRWVLIPEIELRLWSQDDPEIGVGSGLSTAAFGLRLSYAFRREFAPYIGFSWSKSFGNTADFVRLEGEDTSSSQFVAGIRVWF